MTRDTFPYRMREDPSDEVVDLLQHLIRNRCVNDGHVASGNEVASADVLRAHLEGSGLDLEVVEPAPAVELPMAQRYFLF